MVLCWTPWRTLHWHWLWLWLWHTFTLEVVLGTYLKMPRAKFRHTLINCSKKAGLCSSLKPLRHSEDIEGEGATTIGGLVSPDEGCSLKLAPTGPKIAGVRNSGRRAV
jgi:hypothetical protein